MSATSRPADPPRLTLYARLNCPYSALANYRASWLEATLRAVVDVRLVCRRLEDRTPRDVVGDLRERLDADVAAVRDLLVEGPVFPVRVPSRLPDVREATHRYAHHHANHDRPRDRRVRLFRALWLRGLDLADHATLDSIGVPGPPAPSVADAWQEAWEHLPDQPLPLLITPDGVRLGRDEALQQLLLMRTDPGAAIATRA